MAGIAGIASEGKTEQVRQMLDQIAHRGESGPKIIESHGATLGAVWLEAEASPAPSMLQKQAVWDGSQPPLPDQSALEQERDPFALTASTPEGMLLARDALGVCPLYYGRTAEGSMCFASEVKALLETTDNVREFPPGTSYDSQQGFKTFFSVQRESHLSQSPQQIAAQLRYRLEQAISRVAGADEIGCWLSGDLASNSLAALARPNVGVLHTFSVGTPGTPDLDYAQEAASFLRAEHHQITITLDEVLAPLPTVIWHLESFDVALVRSSVTRFLAAKRATDFVDTILFDDGAEEILGTSAEHGKLRQSEATDPMVDSAHRLHNTSLQRVDRSSSSHGLVAHVPFLDLDVFEYALTIPPRLKTRRNGEVVEQWILREALTSVLPDDLLRPSTTNLWSGAGVGFLLALSAEDQITDQDFYRERVLPSGWTLRDKEELMYYRIFREHFGELEDLSWMSRTA